MSHRAWSRANPRETRRATRGGYRAGLESLEARVVLDASLAPLPDIAVLQYQGDQVVLDGSGSKAPSQTFAGTSSNPPIKATVAQGNKFATFNISHQASGPNDVAFSGPVTVEFFDDLVPMTTAKLE